MSITKDSPFRDIIRIDRESFARALEGTPAAAERDARQYWDAAVHDQIDPLLCLAKFNHESVLGTQGVARTTHSWGNTRTPWFGPSPLTTGDADDATDKIQQAGGASGSFPIYRDWYDGLRSTTARLNAASFVYAGRSRIEELYIHPSGQVWAPAGDANDPHGYLNAVLSYMQAHTTGETQRPQWNQDAAWAALAVDVRLLPEGANNRPGVVLDAQYITIHETDNPDPGAGAEAHAGYLRGAAVSLPASWHYTVDDGHIIQNLPDNELAYHAGDGSGPGNSTSIAIEICVNKHEHPDLWQAALQRAARLTAYLCRLHAIPVEHVVEHNFWKRSPVYTPKHKDCPHFLRSESFWQPFLAFITRDLEVAGATTDERLFPETGFRMYGGIYQRWREYGEAAALDIYGYPIEDEHDAGGDYAVGTRIQHTQRARFEWRAGQWPAKWDVTLGLLGSEALSRGD